MEIMNFDNTYVICTHLGYISSFKEVSYRNQVGFSYDYDWDKKQRSYFSKEDAAKVQKCLREAAVLSDESKFVGSLKNQWDFGFISKEELHHIYKPCHLSA
jgi:hypothetical protein